MCFVWIWEQTAIIFLYSINWLVFITETECVYCAVRSGSLYTIQVNFALKGITLSVWQHTVSNDAVTNWEGFGSSQVLTLAFVWQNSQSEYPCQGREFVYKLVYSGRTRINQNDAEEADKNTSNSGSAWQHLPPVDVDIESYTTPLVPEEYCLLGCEAVQFGRNLPTFRCNVHSPPSHLVLLTWNANTIEALQKFVVA